MNTTLEEVIEVSKKVKLDTVYFLKGEDGSFDNVTVGINKAARKEKVRKAIQESKRKSAKKKSAGRSSRRK